MRIDVVHQVGVKLLAAASFFVALPVVAQVPALDRQSGALYATLRGIVVDSARGGLLKGASVGVLGASQMRLTDSLGRFSIDSIPPGDYTVELFAGLLDTLSLKVVSAPIRFTPGDTVVLALAIPSQQTIIAAKCGSLSANNPAALLGTVLRAENGLPVGDAAIRFEWTELTIAYDGGVKTDAHNRVATSDARGRFRICGLPGGLSAQVSASRGPDSTVAVGIVYGESPLGLVDLFLPGSSDPPSVPAERVTGAPVQGTVVDGEGKGMPNALVTLSSNPTSVTTQANGSFQIEGLRLGTQALVVRKLGYRPVEIAVNVVPGPSPLVTIELDQFVPVLESVLIRARRDAALERIGFARRKYYGLGQYFDGEEVRDFSSLLSFMQTVPVLTRQIDLPRVTVSAGRPGDPVSPRAGSGSVGGAATGVSAQPRSTPATICRRVFIDGVHLREGDDIDLYVKPNEVGAIETYSAVMTPAEFRGFDNCPTILIWTEWRLRRGF